MPPISIMLKPASGLCNMRCTYCFYADEMKNRTQSSFGIMSLDTLENVIKKTLAFAEGECTIMYQGGEPTLAGLDFFQKSVEFQAKYNVNNVKIHNALQTNGYAIDDEWCEFFRENHFLIGLSVDGIKATHDAYRKDAAGRDTYFKILQTAKRLEQHHVEYNILTVVNGKTAPKIRKIYEQYKKQGFQYQQYIACLDPIGEGEGNHEYSLKPDAYGQFLCDLFELWEIDLQLGKQPYIRQIENWIGILMGQAPEACDQNGVCGIQNVVEADGSVYPCDFYVLDDYCIGNLNKDSMEEIYRNRKNIHFVEDSYNHSQECRICKYNNLCRGGCRRHRVDTGVSGGVPLGTTTEEHPEENLQEYHNMFCPAYKLLFDKHYEDLLKIAQTLKYYG